jgi:hypothetical protein
LAIQYRSTASSAAKSTATVTDGGRHANCSRNSRSGPISLSREKTSSNNPAGLAAQRDASTDTTAVHFRSSVDGCISENWTCANAKVGLHACWPAACVTQIRGIAATRNAGMQDRFMRGPPCELERAKDRNLPEMVVGRGGRRRAPPEDSSLERADRIHLKQFVLSSTNLSWKLAECVAQFRSTPRSVTARNRRWACPAGPSPGSRRRARRKRSIPQH